MRRANDPQRQEKIVQTTLDAVITHGIHGVTHREITMIIEVPLGSMTYHFSGIDKLLIETFGCFTGRIVLQCQGSFANVGDMSQACRVITGMIYGSRVITLGNMEPMYQLYAFTSRKPALETVMQDWMLRSQQTLERWFDPVTARALDAFIEGVTPHPVMDKKPLRREGILLMVERVTGISAAVGCA